LSYLAARCAATRPFTNVCYSSGDVLIRVANTVDTFEACAQRHDVVVCPVVLSEGVVDGGPVVLILAPNVFRYDFALALDSAVRT
jgi:hypothetical protein